MLFNAKHWYTSFQELVRSERPYADGFVPEYNGDDGSEEGNEQVFAGETLHKQQKID